MILTNRFLNSLDTKVGDDLVVYDEANRKVFFFHHSEYEYRLRQVRSKRRKTITIKKDDRFFCIGKNGDVSTVLSVGFTREN